VVAARIAAAPGLAEGLAAEALLAYNNERPLIDEWLNTNRLPRLTINPGLIAPDLRGLRALLVAGYGWSALPAYLCRRAIARGDLSEIPAPVAATTNAYFMVWSPAALRQPRIALARQSLITALEAAQEI